MYEEIWKIIPGWPYEASNLGRIRRSPDAPKTNGATRGKVLRSCRGGVGNYLYVGLNHKGKRWHTTVHILVAFAFLGPRPEGKEVNHKDGDKYNNCIDNLEYVTHQENQIHAARVLKRIAPPKMKGSKNPSSKLTEPKVKEIRRLLALGDTIKSIAERFRVGKSTINRIKSGTHWKHVR